jgi:ERCC4-related helicase
LLIEHFKQDPESRVIIFTSLRTSVDALVGHVQGISGLVLLLFFVLLLIFVVVGVKCSRFVGQSGDKKERKVKEEE